MTTERLPAVRPDGMPPSKPPTLDSLMTSAFPRRGGGVTIPRPMSETETSWILARLNTLDAARSRPYDREKALELVRSVLEALGEYLTPNGHAARAKASLEFLEADGVPVPVIVKARAILLQSPKPPAPVDWRDTCRSVLQSMEAEARFLRRLLAATVEEPRAAPSEEERARVVGGILADLRASLDANAPAPLPTVARKAPLPRQVVPKMDRDHAEALRRELEALPPLPGGLASVDAKLTQAE